MIVSLNIDERVARAIQLKFPRQVSKITESYFRGLLDLPEDKREETNIDFLENEKKETAERIEKLKIKQKSLSLQLEQVKVLEKKKLKKKMGQAAQFSKGVKASGALWR